VRVLITRLSSLGDIVHTWPLAAALWESGRTSSIVWVVEEAFAPLVVGHPAVDRVVTVATRRWRHRPLAVQTWSEARRALALFRAERPDLALDPQGLVKSAALAWLSGARRRVGLAGTARREAPAGLLYTETIGPGAAQTHVVDINLALLAALDIEPPRNAIPDGRFLLGDGEGPAPPPGCLALLPATGGRGKSWPVARFAELARRWAEAGTPVRTVWGPGERGIAEAVGAASGGAAELAPPTELRELASYLSRCLAVVGGDTGPLHLAASLGVPALAIHLATDAARNGPRGRRAGTVGSGGGSRSRGGARTSAAIDVGVSEVDQALRELLRDARGAS
jgi:lipopolysaccharide heptosyltransferase I